MPFWLNRYFCFQRASHLPYTVHQSIILSWADDQRDQCLLPGIQGPEAYRLGRKEIAVPFKKNIMNYCTCFSIGWRGCGYRGIDI